MRPPDLGFNRKTLKKYELDVEISEAAKSQQRNGRRSPKALEKRAYSGMLRERDKEIAAMRVRCEALIGRICVAEGNALRLGIDPEELWKPLGYPIGRYLIRLQRGTDGDRNKAFSNQV